MIIHRPLYWGAAFLLLASGALVAAAQSAARLPADLDPDSRARVPYLQRKDMDERGQKIYDTLPGRSPEGVLRGPLAFAAYNPAVAHNISVDIRFLLWLWEDVQKADFVLRELGLKH